MIALIFSLVMFVKVPIDYFYEEIQPVGISRPINRADRRKRNK